MTTTIVCDHCKQGHVVSRDDQMSPSYYICTEDYTHNYLRVYCPLCKCGWTRVYGQAAREVADKLELEFESFRLPGASQMSERNKWMAQHNSSPAKLALEMAGDSDEKRIANEFYALVGSK